MQILVSFNKTLQSLKKLDFLGLTCLRLYLSYVFWIAGTDILNDFQDFSSWINSLGFPLSDLFVYLIIGCEMGGAILLLVGLFVRWISIPLMLLILLAMYSVLWENSWLNNAESLEIQVGYLVILLVLLFSGAGKYLSLDYWVSRN